jgi:hypothetical protein
MSTPDDCNSNPKSKQKRNRKGVIKMEYQDAVNAGEILLKDLEDLKDQIKAGDPNRIKEGFIRVFSSESVFQHALSDLELTEFENFGRQIIDMNTWIDIAYRSFISGKPVQPQYLTRGIRAIKNLIKLVKADEKAWEEE